MFNKILLILIVSLQLYVLCIIFLYGNKNKNNMKKNPYKKVLKKNHFLYFRWFHPEWKMLRFPFMTKTILNQQRTIFC